MSEYGVDFRNEILISSGCRKEFDEAIDYFEDIEAGLGYDFAVEVYLALKEPQLFQRLANIRRKYPQMFGQQVSIWDLTFRGERKYLYCGCYALA